MLGFAALELGTFVSLKARGDEGKAEVNLNSYLTLGLSLFVGVNFDAGEGLALAPEVDGELRLATSGDCVAPKGPTGENVKGLKVLGSGEDASRALSCLAGLDLAFAAGEPWTGADALVFLSFSRPILEV